MAYHRVNGLDYWVEAEGEGPLLFLLHGFTGSGASWAGLAPLLTRSFRTVRPDLIGHGRTGAPPEWERYRMERVVDDLLELAGQLGGSPDDPFFLLGYSMGGRIALHAALREPDRVLGLVLESTSYGIADPAERAERRRRDDELAASIEAEGLEAFVNRWERLPLFATQRSLPPEVRRAQRAQRLAHSPRGLANALRGLSPGRHEALLARLGDLTAPTLIVAGKLDAKYAAAAGEMCAALPDARLALISGAGHNVHLERPGEFERVVVPFLEGLLSAGSGAPRPHPTHIP